MTLKDYRVSFKLQDTLYIKTLPSFKGEEGVATLIMTTYNCPRTAITSIEELQSLS